jgi:FeS assembly SUF system protein
VLNQSESAPSEYILDDPGLRPTEPVASDPSVEAQVVAALRTISDPEIPLNVYDMGLVYRVDVSPENAVQIDMTLTSPGCPVAGVLIRQVHEAVRKLAGIASVRTELVWEPPWSKDRMSEEAQFSLGLL